MSKQPLYPGRPVPAFPGQASTLSSGAIHNVIVGSPVLHEHRPLLHSSENSYSQNDTLVKPMYDAEATSKAGSGRFVVAKYHDVWASVVFMTIVLAMVITSIVVAVELWKNSVSTSSSVLINRSIKGPLDVSITNFGLTVLVCSGSSILMCFILMFLMKVHPKAYIISANILSILSLVGCAVLVYFSFGTDAIGAVIAISICALLQLIVVLSSWSCIPISSFLLSYATRQVFRYPALLLTSFLGYIAHCFFMAVTILSLAKVSETQDRDGSVTVLGGILYSLITLAWYWYGQVVCNVVHVTVSGVVATVYFLGTCMPSNPTWKSFVRSMTTSFGSICFGSLVVAIFQLIRAILRDMVNNRRSVLLLCADCIMGFIESLMEWFNTYAFTYIAIYGDSYLKSASKAWKLITSAPCSVVFNSSLINTTIVMSSTLVTCVTTVVVIFSMKSIFLGFICGIWTFVICFLMLRVVNSAVIALFVCVADAPDALQYSEPELHAEIQRKIRESN